MQLKRASTYPQMRGRTLGEGGLCPRAREAGKQLGLARKTPEDSSVERAKVCRQKDGDGPHHISDTNGPTLD